MSEIVIPGAHRVLITSALSSLDQQLNYLHLQLVEALGTGTPSPSDVTALRQRLEGLRQALEGGSRVGSDARLPVKHAGALKTVLQYERRKIAARVASFRRNTQHPELLEELEQRLAPFKHFASQDWFESTEAIRLPLAEDYLTVTYLDSKRPPATAQAKVYDPKHGVFLSSTQLWVDLPSLRDSCDSRRIPLSLLFVDVDDFKALNSKYGEPRVDRDLLPTLMRAIETAFYGHGTIYRFGGDEFVVVIPNAPRPVLTVLIDILRAKLLAASYPSIPDHPTVSIGAFEIPPSSVITEDEAVEKASAAKRHAKGAGKNCTASFVKDGPTGPTFEVWRRQSAA